MHKLISGDIVKPANETSNIVEGNSVIIAFVGRVDLNPIARGKHNQLRIRMNLTPLRISVIQQFRIRKRQTLTQLNSGLMMITTDDKNVHRPTS
jgi:hypothetical protein